MLVLSRKEGERIVIGDDITVVITKVHGNRVTLGIEAPKHVRVVREELVQKIAPPVVRESMLGYSVPIRTAV